MIKKLLLVALLSVVFVACGNAQERLVVGTWDNLLGDTTLTFRSNREFSARFDGGDVVRGTWVYFPPGHFDQKTLQGIRIDFHGYSRRFGGSLVGLEMYFLFTLRERNTIMAGTMAMGYMGQVDDDLKQILYKKR